MDHLTERNSSLLRRVAEAEGANAAVKSRLQQFHQKLRHVQGDNSLLQQQTAFLQKQQQQQQKVSLMQSCCQGLRSICCADLLQMFVSFDSILGCYLRCTLCHFTHIAFCHLAFRFISDPHCYLVPNKLDAHVVLCSPDLLRSYCLEFKQEWDVVSVPVSW